MQTTLDLFASAGLHPLVAGRKLRDVTQARLEELAGLPKTTVSKIESGAIIPDPATRERIAMALLLDAGVLFPATVLSARPARPVAPPAPEPIPEPPMTPQRREAIDAALTWVCRKGRRFVSGETETEQLDTLFREAAFEGWGQRTLPLLTASDRRRLLEVALFLGGGERAVPERRAAGHASLFLRPALEGGGDGWRLTDAEIQRRLHERPIRDLVGLDFPELLRDRGDDGASVWTLLSDEERQLLFALVHKRRALAAEAVPQTRDDDEPTTRRF